MLNALIIKSCVIVLDHLLMDGMSSTYTKWIHHGETDSDGDKDEFEPHDDAGDDGGNDGDSNNDDEDVAACVHDLFCSVHEERGSAQAIFVDVIFVLPIAHLNGHFFFVSKTSHPSKSTIILSMLSIQSCAMAYKNLHMRIGWR